MTTIGVTSTASLKYINSNRLNSKMSGARYHHVYFEIFGKKMKVKVMADNTAHAKKIVTEKIIFHKVEKSQSDDFNQILDTLDALHDIVKGK